MTLNYCRAALHRIRRAGSKAVMLEEQQRILNNLDLNQISDSEVISLYRAILDEISQVEITDRERIVIDEQYRRGIQRKMSTDVFVIGAQAATGQLGSVIQSGANSWWDYRNTQFKRDQDLWQVEKTQFTTFMSRSSTFLDSVWKLSRKNTIPDRWLLRDQDLDQLGDVLAEQNSERRLRMLARMERFMECYPPYWYYVARTQQQMGQIEAAAQTFEKLADLGRGHFRQDDMLASSMANLSLLLEQRNDPRAVETALSATDYSPRNWEANLISAWILERHEQLTQAEDRILTNLDENLESDQSSIALVSLYYRANDRSRLSRLLEDDAMLSRIPAPGLLVCAKLLGQNQLPRKARSLLASSLLVTRRLAGRSDTLVVSAGSGWRLTEADARISDSRRTYHAAGHRQTSRGTEVNFVAALNDSRDSDLVSSMSTGTMKMQLHYRGTPPISIVLAEAGDATFDRTSPDRNSPARRVPVFGNALSAISGTPVTTKSFRINEIEVDGVRLSFQDSSAPGDLDTEMPHRVLKPEFSGDDANSSRF